jgi:hypothetical protein
LAISGGKSMFEDSTWQTKAPVAVVKATAENVLTGWTIGNYYALTKTVYNQGGKPQYQIDEIDANGEWKNTKQWISNNDRLSKFEEVFNQDLNGDGQKTTSTNPIVPTVVTTDNYDASKSKYNNGVAVAKDGDNRVFLVNATYTNGTGTPALTDLKPVVYMGGSIPDLENGWSNSTERYERKIIAAEKVDNKDEYLLAVKNTKTILATNKVEITWDVSLLKAAAALSTTGTGTAPTTGSTYSTYYPPSGMAGSVNSELTNALYITETTNTAAIAGREREFGQDLNGDGKFGIDLDSLTKLATDKNGVRLAKDANGALYISQVKNNVESAVALSGGMMGLSAVPRGTLNTTGWLFFASPATAPCLLVCLVRPPPHPAQTRALGKSPGIFCSSTPVESRFMAPWSMASGKMSTFTTKNRYLISRSSSMKI